MRVPGEEKKYLRLETAAGPILSLDLSQSHSKRSTQCWELCFRGDIQGKDHLAAAGSFQEDSKHYEQPGAFYWVKNQKYKEPNMKSNK